MKRKIILDCDNGLGIRGADIDDGLAIGFLAAHPGEIELLGITAVAGNVTLPSALKATLYLRELLDLGEVPICTGAEKPLNRNLRTGHRILSGNEAAPPSEEWFFPSIQTRPSSPIAAVDFMIEQILRNPGEITLVAIGPQTNLAMSLQREPGIAGAVKEIVCMGGWFFNTDQADQKPEFNIQTDPAAARAVLQSGAKITYVPLDVTLRAMISPEDMQPWQSDEEPMKSFHVGTLDWMDYLEARFGKRACCLHDPMATAFLLYPSLFETRDFHVEIDEATGVTTPNKASGVSPNTTIVTNCDFDGFKSVFLKSILSLGVHVPPDLNTGK